MTQRWFDVVDRRGQRMWWISVMLGAAVSFAEVACAAAVFFVFSLATDVSANPTFPVIGSVRDLLPGKGLGSDIRWIAALAVCVFLARAMTVMFHAHVLYRAAFNHGVRLSERLMGASLARPYRWHLDQSPASLANTIVPVVQQFIVYVYVPTAATAAQILLILALVVTAFLSSPVATLAAGGLVLATSGLVLLLMQKRLAQLGVADVEEGARSLQVVSETFNALREVKLHDLEARSRGRLRASRRTQARANYIRSTLTAVPRVALETITVVGLLVFLSAKGASTPDVIATIGLFGYVFGRLLPAVNSVVSNLNAIRFGEASVAEIRQALDGAPTEHTRDVRVLSATPSLELQRVTFGYEDDGVVLWDIDLVVPFGTRLGIAGRTGSGKSTLLDVMLGLLEPSAGEVLVDGQPLGEVRKAWSQTVGMVSQHTVLFDESIRENITLADGAAVDDVRLARAVAIAQLDGVLAALPDGLSTVVGERGIRLSGGQRQRVALARALYRGPAVLILDEGTSALDNATERALMAALDEERRQRTVILVAHRLSTIKHCDQIVVLEGGEIVGRGTYAELAAANIVFQELAATEPQV